MTTSGGPRGRRPLRSPWVHLALACIVVALLQAVAVKPFQIPSASMTPTLIEGDRFLVNRLAYVRDDPRVGDVVVFSRPASWPGRAQHGSLRTFVGRVGDTIGIGPSNLDPLVKRIVAGPGQQVECCDEAGRVLVDGEPLSEPYVVDDAPFPDGATCGQTPAPRCFEPIVVPPERWFVLGDDRASSLDSAAACRGQVDAGDCAIFVPTDDLIGRAFLIVWPLDRFGPLPRLSRLTAPATPARRRPRRSASPSARARPPVP